MEGYPESDLDVTVSIFEGRYSSFSDMDWEVNTGWWTEGEAPEDNLTLGWSDNHYVYDGQSGSNNVDLLTRNAEGAVWQWDDSVLDRLDTESGYCTAYLDRQATCDKRHVYGTFEHTWEEVEIYSITFGGGGVSITYTDSTKFWRKFPEAKFGGC